MRRAHFVAKVLARLAPAAAAAGFALPISAQEAAPAAAAATPTVEEVVVTGSRIKAPNEISASPIQVVTTADIQATGKTDISDVLYQLPQMLNNDLGQDFSNRTTGLSTPGGLTTADLRGLGPNRTLVLVDGIRLGQGSPQTTIASPAPNLDQIPSFLVERVEVLTGGASSTYGSDAIAGVVNFIMKKNFQGLQIDGQWGVNQHDNRSTYMNGFFPDASITPISGNIHDGQSRNFNLIGGTNFADNKGNITVYLSYRHLEAVPSSHRDFGQCQLTEDFDDVGNVVGSHCFGSTNANRFTPLNRPGFLIGPNVNKRFGVVGDQFVPWTGSFTTNPPEVYNSQPFIYMQRNSDRYMGGFLAHEDLADYARPYFDLMVYNDKTHQAIAPSAAFTTNNPNTGGPYYVNCGNPFLSAQQQGILGCTAANISGDQSLAANQVAMQIGRRNVEGGPRSSDYEHINYRAVLGIQGDFADAWHYDAYGQYYYVNYNNQQTNYLSYAKIDNALLAVHGAKGVECLSGPPCVPWNIFTEGGVTQDQVNSLYALGTTVGNNTLRTLHADITGELGKYGIQLPTAHDGIGVNVGVEHRNEQVIYKPDELTNSGQLSGAGGTQEPLNNSVGVNEGFIELRAPLLQDLPFAKDLIVDGGYRHSNYSESGGINTYKVDLQWAPIQDIRFRGSYQRAIRAPSVSELFNAQNLGLIAFGNDPCAAPTSASLQQCLHTVSAANAAAFTAAYGNGGSTNTIPQAISGQLGQVQGGNPQLQPEKAKSYSAGMLFVPTVLPNFSGSVDFWQIKIEGEVGTYPANVLMTNCLATGNPVFCSQIVRTTTDFSLQGASVATGGYILQTNQNIASVLQSGVDLQMNYQLHLGSRSSLLFALNGVYLMHASTTPLPGGGSYDCAGLYGTTCQTINSRWRHNLRTTWATPWDLDLSLNWRFIGKVGQDNNDPQPLLAGATYGFTTTGAPAFDYIGTGIGNISYIDFSFDWRVYQTPKVGFDIHGGVANLMDKQPPILTNPSLQGGGQANTFASYDVLGRQAFIGFTLKL
jgi:outer membrane receptor protein involved in Fe transport